jgi:hypothetical protein
MRLRGGASFFVEQHSAAKGREKNDILIVSGHSLVVALSENRHGWVQAAARQIMRARKRLGAASTLPEDARLAPFAKFLLQTTKQHAESVAHTSLGLRLRRNPREAPPKNSTLKACHIADTKDGFHCKATKNG